MATAMERKFTGLRKRLDQLGYRQPLGVESVPLVERVVADLLHTTESLKICKLQVVKNKEQKGLWQQNIQPYRHDNARLTQENLELHQKLLKLKETSENRNKDLKIALRRMEHENTDLKFLNTQYMQKLLNKEKESQAKSEKILQLQEKNSQAVIHTPGGRKKHIAFRKQRMDIDSTLPDAVSAQSIKIPPDPYIADLLKVADNSIIKLREEIITKDKQKTNMLDAIEDLKKQVDRREKEIERLVSQLRGGRPPEALVMEGKIDGNERMVAHLNIQIDFLQKANSELEKQITNEKDTNIVLKERVNELSEKNTHICTELQEIGELVKVMENERKENEHKLRDECQQWRTRLQEYKENQQTEITTKLRGYDELLADNREMARLLSTSQHDSHEAASLIETLTAENRQLKKQIYTIKDIEYRLKERIKKLEQMRPSIDQLSLQRERDELKETIKEIEQQLIQIQEDAKILTQDRNNFKILYEQVNHDYNAIRRGSHHSDIPQRIQGERNDARLEIQQLRLECDSLRERLRLAKQGNEQIQDNEQDRLITLSQELDEVTDERDNLMKRIETLQELIKHFEEELLQSKESLTQSLDNNRVLQNKLHTIQGLMDAVERKKTTQHKGLQEQVANSESAQIEISHLNNIIYQLQGDIKNSNEREREIRLSLKHIDEQYDELRIKCVQKDEEIQQLKTERKELNKECSKLSTEKSKLTNTESSKQIQLQAKDNEIITTRQRLSIKEDNYNHLQINYNELDKQVLQLKQDLTTMTQENQTLHNELRKISEERDRLRDNVEEYGRNAMKYEELLTAKEQERTDLMESHKRMSEEIERLDHTVKYSREQELSWQLELTNLQKEKQQLNELCHQQQREIEQHMSTLHSYEIQLSNLTNAMSRMEQNIRQEQEEKKALLIDLSSVRELCVQIEKTKESFSRQLASQSVTHDQTHSDIIDITAERDLLKQQLAGEQTKSNSLEALLSHQRKKEFQSELSDKERDVEIQHLKQQIAQLETDNVSHKEQVHKLRGDINIKAEQLERLKAELMAEKFQKEHVQKQVNKLRLAVDETTPTSIRNPLSPTKQQLDEAIEKSKENISSESARIIDQLIMTSSS